MSQLDGGIKEELEDAFNLKIEVRQLIRRLAGVPGQPGMIALTEDLNKNFEANRAVLIDLASRLKDPAALRSEIEALPKGLIETVRSAEFGDAVRVRLQSEVDSIVQAGRGAAVEAVSADLHDEMAGAMRRAYAEVFGNTLVQAQQLSVENEQLRETNGTLRAEITRLHDEVRSAAANPRLDRLVEKSWGFGMGILVGTLVASMMAIPGLLAILKTALT